MAAPIRDAAHAPPLDRSVGELLHDLSDGTARLVRQEIQLARTEAVESLLDLRRGSVWLGVGVALALCATATGIAFLVLVISRYALAGQTWLAALIVAIALGIIGALCAWYGIRALSAARSAPHDTAITLKETAQWLKHPTRSGAT